MTSTRATAAIVGALFIAATVAFAIGEQLITGVMSRPDFLIDASDDAIVLTAGALLAFVDGVAVMGIAVLMYPLLRREAEGLALGYVGLRVVEFAAILMFLASPLLVVATGQGIAEGGVDASASGSLGALFQAQHDLALRLIYLSSGVAGALFAFLLYRSTLVPRWISVLGVIGYPVLLAGTVGDMFGLTDVTQGVGLLALVPGGLFELILPIWLIARGFSHAETTERSAMALAPS